MVSLQVIKADLMNPVKTLWNEYKIIRSIQLALFACALVRIYTFFGD